MNVLGVSFDGLEQIEKEIFLDIACFFSGCVKSYVMTILNNCGFYLDIEIRVLIDRSLLTIENSRIIMHDMLQELGRKIAREKAPKEPRMWSRLWDYLDIQNVLLEKKAIGNLEAIQAIRFPFRLTKEKKKTWRAEGLSKMSSLRLLIVGYGHNFSGSLKYISNELRHLEWDDYTFTSLPSSFELDNLVELRMHNSNIKQLWKGRKRLYNLRTMDLTDSKNLLGTSNFREVPNLECLILKRCTNLVRIKPSIGRLSKLVDLNLEGCTSLLSLPKSILCLSSHEVQNLSGCSKTKLFINQLLKRGRNAEHLKKVDISEAPIQCQSTSSIFSCLRNLNLSFCNLLEIPNAIGWLHCLESLDLGGNNFVTLPSSIKKLSRLIYLSLQDCKEIRSLFEGPSGIVLPERRELDSGVYPAGLKIFNCPRLVEMQGYDSMAVSWIIEVIKVYQESSLPCPWIHIIIPGTQIPRWFNSNYQSADNSMWMDLSPMMHDNNCIGVAFCLTFSILVTDNSDPRDLSFMLIQILMRSEHGKTAPDSYACMCVTLRKDLMRDQMDHLYLSYVCREAPAMRKLVEEINDDDVIIMSVDVLLLPNLNRFSVVVKHWGWRLVYKQDLELETNNDLLIEHFASERMALPLNNHSI